MNKPGPEGAPYTVLPETSSRAVAQAQALGLEPPCCNLVEWAREAILVHRRGRVLYVNPAAVNLFGASAAQQIVGKQTWELIHPDCREEQRARMQSLVDKVPIRPMVESRFLRCDGSAIDVEVQGTSIEFEGEEAIHVSVRDITARKRSQAQLQLAASVFTHAREGIMITDAQANIIDVNAAFTRITGHSREEVLGRNPRLLSSGRHPKDFYAAMWRDLGEQHHWYGEIWNRRKSGELYVAMKTITAVFDDTGRPCQYMALFSDVTKAKDQQKQLERIAHFDPLTGLPNRALLADRLRQAVSQAQRHEKMLAVAYLDLDGFKAVNDNHGHEVGDGLLVALSHRMSQALRDGDTLARIGGDEFVALLLDLSDVPACESMLSRLLDAASQPVSVGDLMLRVTASLGVTFYPQGQGLDADQLLRQADQAMYSAKLAGKNRYHVFDADQDSSIRGRHENLERIRQALRKGEFVLYFQPKVNMRTGTVIGAEALLRWHHPQHGLLLPAAFLPVIEDHSLAVSLGEWVIAAALRQLSLWQAVGLQFPVSVNIGASHLQHASFVPRLTEMLAQHPGLLPNCLELEVLETSTMGDVTQLTSVVAACQKMGVSFSMDDFGTGYSSLSFLKRMPITQLKIDKSFVRSMLDDPDDFAILEGVLGMARAFGRQVVAEGVETLAHGALLLQLGCDLAQGYGIARPMPATDFPGWAAAWLADSSWVNLPALRSDDMPLRFAIVEHRARMVAIEAFLVGDCAAPPPLEQHLCQLGQWLDGAGQLRYGDQAFFAAIKALHEDVHNLSEGLVHRVLSGQHPPGREGLAELLKLQAALHEALKGLVK